MEVPVTFHGCVAFALPALLRQSTAIAQQVEVQTGKPADMTSFSAVSLWASALACVCCLGCVYVCTEVNAQTSLLCPTTLLGCSGGGSAHQKQWW